ncbi:MAG TPA: NADH-quinone oxidoreductase subunit NuoF [Candidatus Aquicultor sp.]|jgi:bidirectional [NiFe] hydrogenase diaphorase subunit
MTNEELNAIAKAEQESKERFEHEVCVCTAAGCLSAGGDKVKDALTGEIARQGKDKKCSVKGVGCLGLCAKGPLVAVESHGKKDKLYEGVTLEDVPAIVQTLEATETKGAAAAGLERSMDEPFFASQVKVVLENMGKIDPEHIEDYIAVGGYQTLYKALTEMSPTDVIGEVTKSGLRGRGGGGYPTGLKWSTVAKANGGATKYVICNADEGDPGAFMDRSVLEGDPHRVIEGMAIAAYAIGAHQGFIYVRAEYPLAIKTLKNAIRQAEKMGLLGKNICGTTFSFELHLRLGAGAFVTGEETALIASVEGRRGMPRPRPPYPAERGLWDCPTLINNVETFANIPAVIREGGVWFAAIGTEKSKGTKVFALAGSIVNTGLIEVPMGTRLRDIIFDIGGGIPEGRRYKAVQTGGPSGGCIPEQFLNMPVDYESLQQVGSIMGSGGMIVMDETSCMVDVARYFMEFCMSESCGKCTPCRVGTAQMYDILCKITEGHATLEDMDMLIELSDLVKNTSLCGLGQSAPNPVLSTLRYFKDEYMAHIVDKTCPAGVCKICSPAKEPVEVKS